MQTQTGFAIIRRDVPAQATKKTLTPSHPFRNLRSREWGRFLFLGPNFRAGP